MSNFGLKLCKNGDRWKDAFFSIGKSQKHIMGVVEDLEGVVVSSFSQKKLNSNNSILDKTLFSKRIETFVNPNNKLNIMAHQFDFLQNKNIIEHNQNSDSLRHFTITNFLNDNRGVLNLPCGEYTLRLMGKFEIPLLEPVTRSVSSSISLRISSKFINFLPLVCKNSPYSVFPLIN